MDRIDQAISLWQHLTWNRLLMTALAAAVILLSTYSWEHRETVVPALVSSTIATIGVSVALALVAIGVGGNVLLTRMDRKSDALDGYLQQQIKHIEARYDAVCQEVIQLRIEDKECKKRLRYAEHELLRLGGKPPPSDWGQQL